jgi:hypothetical protein
VSVHANLATLMSDWPGVYVVSMAPDGFDGDRCHLQPIYAKECTCIILCASIGVAINLSTSESQTLLQDFLLGVSSLTTV